MSFISCCVTSVMVHKPTKQKSTLQEEIQIKFL